VGDVYILSSFRMERIGVATMTWDGTSVSVATGRFAHVLMAADGNTVADEFAAALQAACVAAGKASATVSYSTTTHAYTLSNGGGSFAISFPGTSAGSVMAQILGFTAGATATSHTSTVRPYYVVVPAIDGRSRYTGLRHEQRTTRRQADDGRGYAVGPSVPVVVGQWEHWHEPLAAVFNYAATSAVPWTWEALWLHAGRWQELVLVQPLTADAEPAGVWQMRTPDFDESTHERQFPDGNFAWKVRFSGVRLGDKTDPAAVLREDGAYALREDGSRILRE
jgi:hypothetical protein